MVSGSKLRLGLVGLAALTGIAAGGWAVMRSRARHAATPVAAPTARVAQPLDVAEVVFDGGAKPGWSIEGWGERELPAGAPAQMVFASFGALVVAHEPLTTRYGALSFRFKAPPRFGEFLQVSLRSSGSVDSKPPAVPVTALDVAPLPDGWSEALLPMSALNPDGVAFDRIVIEARAMVTSEPVLVDRIVFTKPAAASAAKAPIASRKLRVTIDCKQEATPIHPLIYGIARGAVASGETAHRIGGNAMTRLNWDTGNVWNTGADWFFENVRGDDPGLRSWLAKAQEQGIAMAVSVPTIGWVAKDATSVGFPVSRFGPQRKTDPQRDAGDGFSPSGKPLEPGAPTQTSEAAPPERIRGWIRDLVAADRASGKRSAALYFLDNEPDLWHQTHRDVHPQPLSYDELLDRTIRYGKAIREADPEAVIAGPCSWGWSGYFFSAKDQVAGFRLQPDRRAHGGVALLPWLLGQLRDYEKQNGVRILDTLDVHYYPQAQNVYGGPPGSEEATAALRLRSTRSLWDPAYRDESWIDESVRLLPRLREWVDENYPGRGISLGEWSFGAEKHISGGLATAEALGRFGQFGLSAAFYWADPPPGSATFWAFRAYRNYDGKGARFQDFSLKTQSKEGQGVSVFASRDAGSTRLVVVSVNLDANDAVELELDASSCGDFAETRAFRYDRSTDGIIADQPGKTDVLPPYSIHVSELGLRPR